MPEKNEALKQLANQEYQYGFVTDVEGNFDWFRRRVRFVGAVDGRVLRIPVASVPLRLRRVLVP